MRSRVFQIIVIVIGLYLVFVLSKSLFDLKKAGGRLGEAREKLMEKRQENEALKQKLEEVSSVEFIEKEAREKLNLQKPGEVVVIMPSQETPDMVTKTGEDQEKQPNWEKWWKLFF